MFIVPSDAIADQCSSLNLIQLDHPNAISPSPGVSPSSSSPSLSCSSISSLKACRSASDQLQHPTFSFPHPVYRNIAAITNNSSDRPSGQHISCIPMGAFDVPSSHEPTIPSVDEDELVDLHWTTGIPCHMMDVFRANPFAAVDLPRTTSTTPPSLGNFTYPNSTQCKIGGLHHATSATKHVLSPDTVERKRKTRAKRARIQPPVIPFPATGPQEMFAYEFRLDLEIQYRSTDFSPDEDYRRSRDLHPSHSLARAIDDRDHLHIPRPVVTYGSEDIYMRSPLENEDVEPSPLPLLPYPRSRTASVPPRTGSEHRVQLPHYPPSPLQLPTYMSLRLLEPANSAPRQGIDEYQPQFNEHGFSSLPPAVPMQAMPERAQAHRPSAMSTPSLIQKPLYACPLCPRDFQLPNGLALHRKWHDRVGNLTTNPTPSLSSPQERVTLKHPHTESDAHGVRDSQLPAQSDGRRVAISGLPSIPYTTPQEADPMSHEQYTTSALSYERQPQECALFHDALQLTHGVDNNTYLAPLDGLSVLQRLPFEQCHTTAGQLCALSSP